MKKITGRKLNDTSWLAQIIQDKMDIENQKNGISTKWHCLRVLHTVVNEADNQDNHEIYYETRNNKRAIIICNIPDLSSKEGTDFDKSGMQCKLRGLAERYKDDEGNYIVSVVTTLDLNYATIYDIDELFYQLNVRD
jgi:hypothetical protein